jgi:hypothetical protein
MRIILAIAGAWALFWLGMLFMSAWKELPLIRPAVIAEVDKQASGIRSDAVKLINEQAEKTRTTLSDELGNTRVLVSMEMGATRSLLASELTKTRASLTDVSTTADKRLALIQADLNGQLSNVSERLDSQLSGISGQLADSLKPLNGITAQVNEALPLFLDCDHNADCLFNRYVGTARGTEKTAEAIGKISTDISTLTHELTKPKPWYKHLTDYLKVGVYGFAQFF